MLLLAFFAFLAQAGEFGMELQGPVPSSTLWLEKIWEFEGWSVFARVEGSLPLEFRRANLKLSWNTGNLSLSPELLLFGNGRLDVFLASSFQLSTSWQGGTASFQVGSKAGLIALNIAPTPLLIAWGALRWEKERCAVEFDLDGPSPWRPGLTLDIGPLALNFGSTFSLTLSQETGAYAGTSGIQIFPNPIQFHSLRWSSGKSEFQAFLASSGQAWCKVQATKGNWTGSAFFSFSPEGINQAIFEVRFAF